MDGLAGEDASPAGAAASTSGLASSSLPADVVGLLEGLATTRAIRRYPLTWMWDDLQMSDEHQPFRRRLTLRRPAPTTVEAELEDHIHHVLVTVGHRDGLVRSVDGRGVRLPWSLRPGAAAELAELVGSAVGTTPEVADAGAYCTHLLDGASSAIRFAGSGAASRRYDLTVTDRAAAVATGTARRDDGLELVLRSDGRTFLDPPPFRGRSLGAGFARWAIDTLDADRAELALLLRRAIWMRQSLGIDLDRLDVLSQSGVPQSSCYASQPQRIHIATRNRGSSLRELPADPQGEHRPHLGRFAPAVTPDDPNLVAAIEAELSK